MSLFELIVRTFIEMPVISTIVLVVFILWVWLIIWGIRAIKRKL